MRKTSRNSGRIRETRNSEGALALAASSTVSPCRTGRKDRRTRARAWRPSTTRRPEPQPISSIGGFRLDEHDRDAFRTHVREEHRSPPGLTARTEYADGMVEHDGHVGPLLNKLDELGIASNTIFFTRASLDIHRPNRGCETSADVQGSSEPACSELRDRPNRREDAETNRAGYHRLKQPRPVSASAACRLSCSHARLRR
jgi:hypothetical protein